MTGTHRFSSTEFIQSGTVAQFKNGIEATGNSPTYGFSTTGTITANSFDGLPIEPTPPSLILYALNADGNQLITSANVGDIISIHADGDFDNYCFVKNIDDGVAGEIIVGELNEEPEDLTNLTFTATDYTTYSDYSPPLSIITNGTPSNLDEDETIVFLSNTSVPFILSIDLGVGEQKVISKYIIHGSSTPNHDSLIFNNFTFEGSNDNFVSDINILDTQTGVISEPFDSGDINNSTP